MIAVVAGGGDLSLRVIAKLIELKKKHIVVSIEGFGPRGYEQFKIGHIGEILEFIKSSNVREVMFCGHVKRPRILSLDVDELGKRWLRQLGVKAFLGDNALLKGVRKLLEKEGISIVSPRSVLSSLITPQGVLTNNSPSENDLKDIARGIFVLNAMSRADVGQAVIVQEGVVLGIEAAEGTKRLIERCLDLKLTNERGGELVKTSKVDQDQDIDLPTIGRNTILEAEYSKLSGVAIGFGKSQIVDYEDTVELANKKGIFMIGI